MVNEADTAQLLAATFIAYGVVQVSGEERHLMKLSRSLEGAIRWVAVHGSGLDYRLCTFRVIAVDPDICEEYPAGGEGPVLSIATLYDGKRGFLVISTEPTQKGLPGGRLIDGFERFLDH